MEQSSSAAPASVAVIRMEPGGRVVAWNAAATTLLGPSIKDAVGRVLSDLLPATEEQLRSVRRGETAWANVGADGLRLLLTPVIDSDGRVASILGVSVEGSSVEIASALIGTSDARLTMIEEHTHEWITLNTLEGIMIYSSPSSKDFLGFEPDELMGRAGYEFIHPDDLPAIMASHGGSTARPGGYMVRYRLRRKDGTYLWAESYTKIINGEDGRPALILGSSRNITERKRSQDLLRSSLKREQELRAQLAEADEVRREALAILTHDLVGNVTSLSWMADALHQGVDLNEELVPKIASASARMLERIAELRDSIAREQTTGDRNPEPLDVGEIAEEILAELGLVEASIVGAPGLAIGDRREVEHLFHNLLSNAMKHAPGSDVTIRLLPSDGMIRCSVVDHGPGLDPSERDSVFERFVRGDGAGAGPSSGLGLGLSVVRAMTEANGGTCGVDQTPGGGATFWFTLPALAEHDPVGVQEEASLRK